MDLLSWYFLTGAAIASIAILYFVPKWQAKPLHKNIKDKLELENKFRTTLAIILTGMLIIVTLIGSIQSFRFTRNQIEKEKNFFSKQLELTRKEIASSDSITNLRLKTIEDQLSSSKEPVSQPDQSNREYELELKKFNIQLFDSATQVLDSNNKDRVSVEKKVNSIFILTKLALNDVNYYDIVLKTLATYVKINSPRTSNNSMNEIASVNPDIVESLASIGRIKEYWNSNLSLDLSNTLLTSCKLKGNYNNVDFTRCNLNFSEIRNSTFINSSFINSFLIYAKIYDSKFSNVSFYNSQMDQIEMKNVKFTNLCDLRSVNFLSSSFNNVDMSTLEGLNKDQFKRILDSVNFKLPNPILNQ